MSLLIGSKKSTIAPTLAPNHTMKWLLYNLFFALIYPLLLPKFLWRMWRRGGYARHFFQRLGRYDSTTLERLRARCRVWIHAVSVGEMYVALELARAMRKRDPGLGFVFSTATSTAYAIGAQSLGAADALVYFPLDWPPTVRRVLDTIRPLALVLVEGELWPNLIRQLTRRGTPVFLVNGRLSARSFRGYRRLRPFVGEVLKLIRLILAQSREDAERYIALGAEPAAVRVLGSIKFDMALAAAASARSPTEILTAAGIGPDAPIIVGGSTWPGEEQALLKAFARLRKKHAEARLVLVPRHAERANQIAAAIERSGLTWARHTALKSAGWSGPTQPEVLLVDTTGELKAFYAAASVVFVGKSLCARGGQNLIEPAAMGKPVIVGPHMENFAAIMAEFRTARAAFEVQDQLGLESAIDLLLSDPAERAALGQCARDLVCSRAGVAAATASAILESMPNPPWPSF